MQPATLGGPPDDAQIERISRSPASLQEALGAELAELERELAEIGMLGGQALEEAGRHETRRVKGEERVTALEADPKSAPDALREARSQLLTLTRRQLLFEAQNEVLEGKHQALTRYRDSLVRVLDALGGTPVLSLGSAGSASFGAEPGSLQGRRHAGSGASDSMAVVRAQEDLRREIARQMHDGPAQSLANIALQSEIVERLVGRGDPRAKQELVALRGMVQATLTATKAFIFDVRPMVLDDLGLVPTLRRSTGDRSQRAGIDVAFDSSGTDRRLSPDLETGLFRIVDELLAATLAGRPERVSVHLDWSARDVTATVRSHWPSGAARAPGTPVAELPPALAEMIREANTAEHDATLTARSLPADQLGDLVERARMLGISLTVLDEGTTIEVVAPIG